MTTVAPFKNPHLSYSRLSRFETCPLSYRLHYIEKQQAEPGLPLRFGKTSHAVLERLIQEVVDDERSGPLSEEQSEFVKTIHGKGEQLLGLIMGLLDLSKLDSGTMSLRQASTQIAPVLVEVVSTLAPVALKKQVELTLESDNVACELSGDAERLRQVFLNLVENALKFTPRGGKVILRTRVRDGVGGPSDDDDDAGSVLLAPMRREVEVTVSDTGIGIAGAERTKVFDAFYQVDSSSTREYGGTGLGLSIVKRIVDAHGGTVTIEGNEPTGTVFVVRLPSAQARRTLPSRVPPPAGS